MRPTALRLLCLLLFPLAACSANQSGEPSCEGASCDVAPTSPLPLCKGAAEFQTTTGTLACTPCGDALADRSGRGFLPSFIADDALMEKVYMTFEDKDRDGKIAGEEIDCPIDMPAIMAKLNK